MNAAFDDFLNNYVILFKCCSAESPGRDGVL